MLDFSSALQYRNNIETAYLIDGHLQYVWDDGKSSYDFYQVWNSQLKMIDYIFEFDFRQC